MVNRGVTRSRPLPSEAHVLVADTRDPSWIRDASRTSRVRLRRRLRRLHPGPRPGRPRTAPGAGRPVRLHQLRLGVPDAARPPADRRVDPAAQPLLALLPGQDRLRGCPCRRLPGGGLPGDDRPALPHLRSHLGAVHRGVDRRRPHAPRGPGRRPRRRHVAVDAHPPRRLRPGLRARSSGSGAPSATASTSPRTRC